MISYYGVSGLSIMWVICISLYKAMGGFQLEFVSISRVIDHMTCYKFECSQCTGGKFI